ncbi:protein disulfide-isomerase A4 [Paragonimus westermani]|uniref:protein disulfide-isomerase n=1 Tax=Paragonimus westermani TaxID=34504 RepID=A0A5J4NWK6_9TREM|nr:protein disulfide-isomerase A4 [Paragonimus westermani]
MWSFICFVVSGLLHESHGSGVIKLSRNNFTQFRQYTPVFMLLFSVDWCTNCVNMWPEYELAATELSKLNPPIPLAKVDGVADEQLVKQFGVTTFPTVFVLNEELVHRYRGQLRAKYFIDEMKKEVSQGYEIVGDLNEVDLKRTPDDTVLLALCKTLDHPIMKKFRRSLYVASTNFIPLASTSVSLREKFGYNDSDFTVLILKPTRFAKYFQSPTVNVTKFYYNHNLTEVDIAQALAFEQLPLIGLFTEVTKEMYTKNKDRLLCVIPYSISLYKEPNQGE